VTVLSERHIRIFAITLSIFILATMGEGPQKWISLGQWCSNRGPRGTCGPQGPLEWPAKQFSLERKLNTL